MKIGAILLFVALTCGVIFAILKITNKSDDITIAFAGDTMLGRLVNQKIGQTNYSYPLGNIIPILNKTDLNIANLETTLTKSESAVPKVFNFRALPDRVETLKAGRIDVVTLANNHSKDFGNKGLLETISTLNKANIKHVGAGKNTATARRAVVVEKNGIKIGILGYSDNEPGWKAGPHSPGIHYIKIGDIKTIREDIATVRDKVDILIATLPWGPNMLKRPDPSFVEFAHKMIDAGIDIIQGHSAHIFQGIEVYQNKLIMYDTGDFVDDYRVDLKLRNDRSFLFLVTVDKTGPKKLKLIPTLISNMQVNKAEGKDKLWSLHRMQKLSAEFGTRISSNGTLIVE